MNVGQESQQKRSPVRQEFHSGGHCWLCESKAEWLDNFAKKDEILTFPDYSEFLTTQVFGTTFPHTTESSTFFEE